MISLFKDRSAVAVFWLILLCFGLHIDSLINPPPVITSPVDGIFYYILKPLTNVPPYFISLLYVVMIFLLALQINFIMNVLRMFPKQAYTAALAFLLFSALLPAFNVVNAALLACNFLVWILYSACKLYAAPNAKTSIYNFGLLTGLCVIFYFPSILLVIVAILAIAIIRPFKLNEWFVLFFGLITPVYFLAGYLFLTDRFNQLPSIKELFDFIQLRVQPPMIIITLSVAATAVLWGIFSVQSAGVNVLIQIRKSWSVFFVALIFTIPMIFFIPGVFPAILLLTMIPAACYTGYAFANSRNILPVIFFWLLIALSIYNNWFGKY